MICVKHKFQVNNIQYYCLFLVFRCTTKSVVLNSIEKISRLNSHGYRLFLSVLYRPHFLIILQLMVVSICKLLFFYLSPKQKYIQVHVNKMNQEIKTNCFFRKLFTLILNIFEINYCIKKNFLKIYKLNIKLYCLVFCKLVLN